MEKILKMSDVNKIKDQEQKKALNAWAKAGFCGSVIAGTGFGKSRIGILAIEHTLKECKEDWGYEGNILILVPTVQLQNQFRDEFCKWELEHCLDNIDILCYQSAYKLKDKHYEMVLCDEIHLGLSSEYRKFFKNNTYNSLLCMTATMPEEEDYKKLLENLAPVVYEITLDQCVELKLVSAYNVYCMPVKLTEEEDIAYKKANKMFVRYKYLLGQFDAFDNAKAILNSSTSSPQDKQSAVLFYKAIRERKNVVDFAENKIGVLKQIVMANKDKRILTFAGANNFTDRMCHALSPYATKYHSNITKKQKEQNLKDFKEGKYNTLCSTKALNQGIDISDANMGILCGITSKGLTMIQRVGRLLRYKENKVSNIIILYVKDSQEEKWLKNAIKTIDNVLWINTITEINN